jgi:hypothetical protein
MQERMTRIQSVELVPGDLFEVEKGSEITMESVCMVPQVDWTLVTYMMSVCVSIYHMDACMHACRPCAPL